MISVLKRNKKNYSEKATINNLVLIKRGGKKKKKKFLNFY